MAQPPPPPVVLPAPEAGPAWAGDPEAALRLGSWVEGARRSTEAFGPWPEGPWQVRLHEEDATFEQITGAPPGRFATWMGITLHLRPWERLRRRDLGALLRHELAHRRLVPLGWPRWKEEAACLWAEGHTTFPDPWPPEPEAALGKRLDTALAAGTTASQRWAYAWLRAWLEGRPLSPVAAPRVSIDPWRAESPTEAALVVIWPPERLPRQVTVNSQPLSWRAGAHLRFEGPVRFGPDMPVSRLEGTVELEGVTGGWRMTWRTSPDVWLAAATEGELGAEAPFEAKRALAAVLRLWLQGHPAGNHPDGSFCPLTHCAVVRGMPSPEGREAVTQAPVLDIRLDRALFTGSNGGVSWSPREAWGSGSALAGAARIVPGDPWGTWTRVLTAAQVRALKGAVKPGLLPGQRGMMLGSSGPYAVERLRMEAGRRFGWTTWPSNACTAELLPDGSLWIQGRGWGHNVGLCLATAIHRARSGERAEPILAEAFPAENPELEK